MTFSELIRMLKSIRKETRETNELLDYVEGEVWWDAPEPEEKK